MSRGARYERSDLVALLQGSLGDTKASEAVDDALAALGLAGQDLDEAGVLAVLERLAEAPGLLGVTARFAKARIRTQEIAERRGVRHIPSRPALRAVPATAASVERRYTRAELAALLRGSLGDEKATQEVDRMAESLGLPRDDLDSGEAVRLLERLATEPGLVGVTARFALSRFHLSTA